MTKKRVALIILTMGLGLGVIRAFANEMNLGLGWPAKQEAAAATLANSKEIPLETAASLFAFVLAGFSIKGSRRKI